MWQTLSVDAGPVSVAAPAREEGALPLLAAGWLAARHPVAAPGFA